MENANTRFSDCSKWLTEDRISWESHPYTLYLLIYLLLLVKELMSTRQDQRGHRVVGPKCLCQRNLGVFNLD